MRTITCICDSYVATRGSVFGPHDTRHRALVPSYSLSPDGPVLHRAVSCSGRAAHAARASESNPGPSIHRARPCSGRAARSSTDSHPRDLRVGAGWHGFGFDVGVGVGTGVGCTGTGSACGDYRSLCGGGCGVGFGVGKNSVGGSSTVTGAKGCRKDPGDLGGEFAPVVTFEGSLAPRAKEEKAEAVEAYEGCVSRQRRFEPDDGGVSIGAL